MNIKLHSLRVKSLNEIDNLGLYHNDFAGNRFYCRYWMLASHHRMGYRVKEWSYENLPRYCGYGRGWNMVMQSVRRFRSDHNK
jgi:hypothetical protein